MGKLLPALAVLAMLGAGCSHPDAYRRNRALDFADCFRCEVGTGYGLDVQVGASDLLATGIGGSSTRMVGFAGRHPVGPEHNNHCNTHVGFPVYQVLSTETTSGYLGPESCCCGFLFLLIDTQQRNAPREKHMDPIQQMGDPPDEKFSPLYQLTRSVFGLNFYAWPKNGGHGGQAPGPKPVDAFEVTLGATLAVVSARVGFSFGQFADFALGFFGLDIADDDTE